MGKKAAAEGVLTEAELDELRGALEAEKDALDEELATHGKQANGNWQGSSESEGEEADFTDAAGNIEELGVNVPFVAELNERRKEIEAALERMKHGMYGICELCSEPIPFDRLEANPAAKACVEHS